MRINSTLYYPPIIFCYRSTQLLHLHHTAALYQPSRFNLPSLKPHPVCILRNFIRRADRKISYHRVQAFESEHRRRTPASARHPRSAVSNAERPSQQTKYEEITRKFRAFADWPGIWSTDPKDIRVKLVSLNPLLIQYEGKKPLEGKLI